MNMNKNILTLAGARITDAGDTGDEVNDVATKEYVDHWFDPIESHRHYVKYIESRFFLMTPLSNLCKVSTNLAYTGGNIHSVLGSEAFSNTFKFKNQIVTDKYIEVTYLEKVKVDEWMFLTDVKISLQNVTFKWQMSNDNGKTWKDGNSAIVSASDISSSIRDISLNRGQWNFINQDPITSNKAAPFAEEYYFSWRLLGLTGSIASNAHINVMCMELY